jgi:hypothetical protein
MANETLGGFASGFLGGRGLALLPQNVNGFFDIAIRLDKRGTAIAKPRVGSLSEFLDELRWNFHDWFRCTHPFLSEFLFSIVRTLEKWPGVEFAHSAGPFEFSTLARIS